MLVSRRSLLVIAGVIWLVTGIASMTSGIFFIMQSINLPYPKLSAIEFFSKIVKNRSESALLLLTLGLYLGYIVGRFSLTSGISQEVKRLLLLPSPLSLRYLFSQKALLLFLLLIAIPLLFLLFSTNLEMSGFMQLVIGSTLVNGGVTYLRKAISLEEL